MGLLKYKQKRNFNSTTEPKGKNIKSESDVIFVVQKHDASRLHYDFRLELDGVLKSWAIPKGPSMNPDDKRLAIMVEDHPYSYKDFEGNISEGNYGAGDVIVWDNGTYTDIDESDSKITRKNIKDGLTKGHLAFRLNGKKLKGEFALIRLKGQKENSWLLIKKNDDFATIEDITLLDKSVISGNTLPETGKKATKRTDEKHKKIIPSQNKSEISATSEVSFIVPMLAKKVKEPFDKKGWFFETKFDGYRAIAVIKDHEAELYSRNELSFTLQYKPIVKQLEIIDHLAVLDGEIVIENDRGTSGFQLLQNFQRTGKGILKYYIFDIMNLDGMSTMELPLRERKELLKMLLSGYELENIFYSDHIEEQGKSFFELAVKQNWEGIMAKDADSTYRPGKRSSAWLKIKITQEDEAIIIGITEPNGSRKYFGSILLAVYDENNELKFVGKCGTGFNDENLKDLYTKFKPFFTNSSPLSEKISVIGKVQWLEPLFIAQVKYAEITEDNHLRHPVFLGLRVDKETDEVHIPAEPIDDNTNPNLKNEMNNAKDDLELRIDDINLHLTHRNKIYFPESGITKGELISYYNEVAEFILPYLKDRPQNMNRFPNGIAGSGFYNKDVDVEKIPSWLRTQQIFSDSNDKNIDYLICNDKATLLYMANLGCIEINPWNSKIQNLDFPDWMVIDLDPDKDDFREVVKTALTVREVLEELEIEGYCKTSGASGLHIYIPLACRYQYDTVKIFAEIVAKRVSERLPETTTIIRSVQKRNHRIYIDFLQNRFGQTLAAPYSVRPKPGATVSTPLEWSEVNEKLSPSMFTLKNILKRIEKKGDLWKPVLQKGVDLEKALKSIEGH